MSRVPSPAENRGPPPLRLNLENQRKRARALLKAARAGDARALRRLAAQHPGLAAQHPGLAAQHPGLAARHPGPAAQHPELSAQNPPVAARRTAVAARHPGWSLHHAQLVIARELGFKSWAKLKAHIEGDDVALMGALVAAASRALEAELDAPLFVDPLARALAGKKGFALHKELRSTSWPPNAAGPAPEQSIITRYFDDALQAAVRNLSLEQVVLFNAGMDARAFRLRWPAKLALFEVDNAAMFEVKEPVLRRRRAKPACDRRLVRASLLSADWSAKLRAAGFDARRPAAFLIPWIAHLDAAAVDRMFGELGEVACAGSWLGANFVGLDTIASVFMKPLLDKLAALGYPEWKFGVRDPESFLAERGWSAECDVLGAPEASYGRWRYGYLPRTVPDRAIPRHYLAVARRIPGKEQAQ